MNEMEIITDESYNKDCNFLLTPEDCFANYSVFADWEDKTTVSWKKPVHSLVSIIYSVVFVVGLLGNSFIMHVIIRRIKVKTAINIYIFNLALIDALIAATMPLCITYLLLDTWIFGGILCKIFIYIDYCNMYVSAFTVTMMSVDRYMAVCHPDRDFHAPVKAKVVIMCIWGLSLLLGVPIFIFSAAVTYEDTTLCSIDFPASYTYLDIVLNTFALVLGFVVPMTIMSVCYCLIVPRMQSMQTLSGSKEEDRKVRRITRLVMVVVSAFVICWTPINVFVLVSMFVHAPDSSIYIPAMLFCMALAYVDSSLNPIIYICLDENIKRNFKDFCVSAKLKDDKISGSKNIPDNAVPLKTPDETHNLSAAVELS